VTGDYRGQHARIKESLNATATALHEAMEQLANGAEQVTAASGQIAASSQSVAQGMSEQAAALEELAAMVGAFRLDRRVEARAPARTAALRATAAEVCAQGRGRLALDQHERCAP